MTWQILNVEPPYAVCDSCKSHECGIVDGKHMWIQTGIEDKYGDRQVIGYGCVLTWAENLGISKEVVTKVEARPPTDEEIGAHLHRSLKKYFGGKAVTVEVPDDIIPNGALHSVNSPPSDMGQQTDKGTQKPKGNRSRAHNANRATVR